MLFIHCFIIVYDFINAGMKSKGKGKSPRVLPNGSQLHVSITNSNLKGKGKGPIVTSRAYLSWNKEMDAALAKVLYDQMNAGIILFLKVILYYKMYQLNLVFFSFCFFLAMPISR